MANDPFAASTHQDGILVVDLGISNGKGSIATTPRLGIKEGLYRARILILFLLGAFLLRLLGHYGRHCQCQ